MNFGINYFNDQDRPVDGQITRTPDGAIQLEFSTLESLMNLVANSNPEIQKFFKQLTKVEEKMDMKHLNNKIIHGLYRSLKAVLKRDLVISVVHSLFKKKIFNIGEFYCRVLSVYMLNTALPKNLNKCLRSGDLSKADDLLPYLVCLCKAFFCQTLDLNPINPNSAPQSLDLYKMIEADKEADEEAFYNKGVGQKIATKEFALFRTQKPRTGERRRAICLHVEIPAELTKHLKHSIYLELAPNKILFVRESNQAILAPGCEFIVSEVFLDELGTTMIKLTIACKFERKIKLIEEVEEIEGIQNHARVMETDNVNSGIWDQNYDEFNLNE